MWGFRWAGGGGQGVGESLPIVAVVTAVVGHTFGGLIEETGGLLRPSSAFSLMRPGVFVMGLD